MRTSEHGKWVPIVKKYIIKPYLIEDIPVRPFSFGLYICFCHDQPGLILWVSLSGKVTSGMGGWATQFGGLEKTIGNWFLKVPSWRGPPLDTFLLHLSSLTSRFAKSLTTFYGNLHKLLYLLLKTIIYRRWFFKQLSLNSQCPTFKWCSSSWSSLGWFPIRGEGRVWATADTIQKLT